PLPLADASCLDSPRVLKALSEAHRYLAELKGFCEALPNPGILIDTLSIQEAKDSSEIENIVTTHDELYSSIQDDLFQISGAAKEVQNYVKALRTGFQLVCESGLIQTQTILAVQEELERNQAGFRKVPGTVLKNENTGETIYEPPQSGVEVEDLMTNLVDFIHADDGLDPLLRMAICHHQFESIHPFYDGNGRTGRILNILILIRENLLNIPVLYLSRFITTNKAEYYRLLQITRETGVWDDWCCYILKGISQTARNEVVLIREFRRLMQDYKKRMREELPKVYRQELLNNLFRFPYTKIE
ncbi:UNVERIFIED_CONTAM: hypothetical protein GTU68_019239, partial [Idotea baltica]|nr:hypothetical protein [Idotea baltica]